LWKPADIALGLLGSRNQYYGQEKTFSKTLEKKQIANWGLIKL